MFKKFIQKFFLVAILIASFRLPIYAAVDYVIEDQPQVIEQMMQFEQKGILKQKANGYLYVEVSNDFITHSLPLIDIQDNITPPFDYTSRNGIGAHISVITETELDDQIKWGIEEIGQEYTFTVMEVRTVKMRTRDKRIKTLWLLAVNAPELQQLREKYGLSSYLKGHDYHITLGSHVAEVAQRIENVVPWKQ